MSEFAYSVGNHETEHASDNRFDWPDKQHLYGRDWGLVVTDLADDFHGNHDGWEASWPLEFRIYEDGTELARFSIERDSKPVFYSRKIAP